MKSFDYDSFDENDSTMSDFIEDFDSNAILHEFDEDLSDYFEKSSTKSKRSKKNSTRMKGGSKKKKSQSNNDFDYDPF